MFDSTWKYVVLITLNTAYIVTFKIHLFKYKNLRGRVLKSTPLKTAIFLSKTKKRYRFK